MHASSHSPRILLPEAGAPAQSGQWYESGFSCRKTPSVASAPTRRAAPAKSAARSLASRKAAGLPAGLVTDPALWRKALSNQQEDCVGDALDAANAPVRLPMTSFRASQAVEVAAHGDGVSPGIAALGELSRMRLPAAVPSRLSIELAVEMVLQHPERAVALDRKLQLQSVPGEQRPAVARPRLEMGIGAAAPVPEARQLRQADAPGCRRRDDRSGA